MKLIPNSNNSIQPFIYHSFLNNDKKEVNSLFEVLNNSVKEYKNNIKELEVQGFYKDENLINDYNQRIA